MKKRVLSFLLFIAIAISNVLAAGSGNIITLDLSKPMNPESFTFDTKGNWEGTYNDEDYTFIEFEPSFVFSHLIGGPGSAFGGYYWDGFTVCTSGDNSNAGNGDSQAWIDDQWGCMAGGGIKTDSEGNVMKDATGKVMVEKGIPYMLAYWGYYMEDFDHSLQNIFTDGNTYEAVGVYVNNHPWPYYGNLSGDGFASPFTTEGDYFKLIIHGLDENWEPTGKSVEHMLAEYKNGKLIQSPDWEWVDLSSLGEIGGLYYTMESSDADPMFGPNTAVYFCMDKLQVRKKCDVTISLNTVSTTMKLENKLTGEIIDAGSPSGNKYTFQAYPGEYTLYAYATNGTTLNGTIDLTVTDAATQSFQFYTITAYATNSGWIPDTDYTINLKVSSQKGDIRNSTLGSSITANRATFLVYGGDTFHVQYIPNETHVSEGYVTYNGSSTITGNITKSAAIPKGLDYTITIPEGATAFAGIKFSHFQSFQEVEPISTTTEAGNTVYKYLLASSQEYNYRITQPGKVTYAGTFTMTNTLNDMVITGEMLEDNPKKIDHDVASLGGYNIADLFLNINEKGFLKLSKEDTYQIVSIRAWQSISSITGNYFIEPDHHYTVVNENGEPDNSVVTVDKNGILTAVGNGTAIVLITYDAMNIASTNNSNVTTKNFFGAIWPENTGVFVVSVGAGSSGITSNMELHASLNVNNQKLAGTAVDAELDIFYYLEENGGYDYTFTPSNNITSVTLSQPVVGENALSYNGFSTNGVTDNGDGSYTVRLTFGRNIVKLTSASGSEYQVLSAKPVTYTITNATNPGSKIEPGDKASVRFYTLYHPNTKLAGVYNMNATLQYTTATGSTISGSANQYTFANTAKAQTVEVTIPADWTEDSFDLTDGRIKSSGFGDPMGGHRDITLRGGKNPNFTAISCTGYFGALPVISIRLAEEPSIPTNLAGVAGETTIDLSWTASVDNMEVAGYNIYVDGEFVESVTGTTYTLTGLTEVTEYFIEVEAFDEDGYKSEKASAIITTIDETAPSIPQNVSGVINGSLISVTWNACEDNVCVTGYNIYVNGTLVETIDKAYCITTVIEGILSHTIEVEAFDAAGNVSEKASTTVSNAPSVGIDNTTAGSGINVYPNPFADYLVVNTENDGQLTICNLSGQHILNIAVKSGSNYVNTGSLPKGTYIVSCGSATIKVIK